MRRALIVLYWERLQPALLLAVAPTAVLAIAALFGVFVNAPAGLRVAATAAALALGIALFWREMRRFERPGRLDALRRIETDNGLLHTPLTALDDAPFAGDADHPLWRTHIAAAARAARKLNVRAPRATADAIDPFALRYAGAGLLALALVVAGDDRGARLTSLAGDPAAARFGAGSAMDVWIEPPAYTGLSTLYLAKSDEKLGGVKRQIDVPEGSKMIAQGPPGAFAAFRTPKGESARKIVAGGERDSFFARIFKNTPADNVPKVESSRLEIALTESGVLSVGVSGAEARWPIGVKKDAAPAVAFTAPPSVTERGRVALPILFLDDYGAVETRLLLRLDPAQKRPLDAPAIDPQAMREERVVIVPGGAGKPGARRLEADVDAEPWAGLEVFAKVVVVDGKGQTGATEESKLLLPRRLFSNPVAKAVLEQRQHLAVAPNAWARTARAFDAMTLAPEAFYDQPKDYLLMRTAFWRVMRNEGADTNRTVEAFWTLALQLEDATLDQARQALNAARDALKEALERGASEAELARLVENLRQAMANYLQSLAASGEPTSGENSGEAVSAQDLQDKLDALRNLTQSGARNAAQDALDELANLLDNLKISSGGGSSASSGGGSSSASAAAELLGRQRGLADRAFARGQSGGAGGDLAAEQNALGGELDRLRARQKNNAAAEAPLREARTAMTESEDALKAGDFGAASAAMERAIDKLREGAGELAKSEQGRPGGERRDPLGRPIGPASGESVDVPETIDAERARQVREELRRRLSEGGRSEEEIRYLERLLERF
jgi:uncharacterized protein (TIGR02302 family)